MFYPLFIPHFPSSSEEHREPSWGVKDTAVSPEALSVLLLLTGPSLMPKETTTMENDSSKPLTLLVALGSAAKQTSPAGLAPVTQEVLEGRWHLAEKPLTFFYQSPTWVSQENAWIPPPL